MTQTWNDRLRRHVLPILCLTLAPIVVAIIHDDWLFTPITYLDPWYNVGFFLNYYNPDFLPGHYKEARLSWLAPGYFAYKLFGPLAANYILHVGSLIASVVLVYLTLARLVSRNAAFITAALLCAYYPFHGSGGWDYQTVPSGVFYALTLYLLTRAAQSENRAVWLVGAGAAFAATFHANIIVMNMALGLAAHYLVITRKDLSVKGVATVGGWVILGFVILTQILFMVAWSAGRNGMFFQPLVDIVVNYTLHPQKTMAQWWTPWSTGWFLESAYVRYLVVPAALALASAAWLASRALRLRIADEAEGADPVVRTVMVAQYLFVFCLWVAWQSIGNTALQPDYFAHPLIIPAFVALGAMLGPAGRRELIFLGAVVLAALLSSLTKRADVPLVSPMTAYWLVIGALLAAMVVGAAAAKLRTAATIAAAGVFLIGYQAMWPAPSWSQIRRIAGDCSTPKNLFSEIVRLHVLVRGPDGQEPQAWIWNGPTTPTDSMCNIPLDSFRWALLSSGIPPLGSGVQPAIDLFTDVEIAGPRTGDRIVAMVRDPVDLEPLVARFARSGRALTVERQDAVKFEGRHAMLVIYKVAS